MLKLIPGNAQHIGARKEQQDSFGFSDTRDTALVAHGGLVAAVADGMGGLEGGQQSSSIAIEAFMAAYARKSPSEPVPAALRRSLLEANRAVVTMARQTGTAGNTGTTFAAAAVHKDLLYWIATGDSRIYLLRDGLAVQVNADHTHGTTLWPAVAEGRLSRESALNDPQAPHLTSHLGMDELAYIDQSERPFPLQGDDVVAVCSDGIYRSVTEQELAEAFRMAGSPSAACSAIQASVVARGSVKQDNLTILAIQCRDDSPKPVAPLAQAAAPPAKPAANGSAARGPSNLLLGGLLCAELLMAAGLGGQFVWSRTPGPPAPAATGPAIVTQPMVPPSRPQLQTGPEQPLPRRGAKWTNDSDVPPFARFLRCNESTDIDACNEWKEDNSILDEFVSTSVLSNPSNGLGAGTDPARGGQGQRGGASGGGPPAREVSGNPNGQGSPAPATPHTGPLTAPPGPPTLENHPQPAAPHPNTEPTKPASNPPGEHE